MDQVYVFVIGTLLGSAANAIIDRLPRQISWLSGRSKCDHCDHQLAWYDLLPLLSFLLLGGKCRYCHKPIAIRNFLVELLLGTAFVLAYINNLPIASFGLIWITVTIAVMDLETQLVSDILVLIWGGLVLLSIPAIFVSTNHILGAAVAIGVIGGLWAITRGRGMGFGDVEIAAVLGLWLGWPNTLVGLWMAFIIGAAVGVVKIVTRKSKLGSTIAFGPFLILGAWIGQIWGDMILKTLFY